jgi:tetratricopeptide (TPR) repeat protein
VRDRHCEYYITALCGWEQDLKGRRQQAALAEMDVETENVRAAWDWAVERGYVEQLDRAIEGLALFYDHRSRYHEGEAAFREASDRLAAIVERSSGDEARHGSGNAVRVLARTLAWCGIFGGLLGRAERSDELLQRSLALLEGPELAGQDARSEMAFVLWAMGESEYLITSLSETDRARARARVERSLALHRDLGDRWWIANVLHALAHLARASEDYEQAKLWFAESADGFHALGDAWRAARSTWRLGFIYAYQGQVEEAERLGRDSYAIYQELGGTFDVGLGSITLAVILGWRGKFEEACALAEQGFASWRNLGLRRQLATWNAVLARHRLHLGRYGEARAHAQETLSLAQEYGDKRGIALSLRVLGYVALTEGAYAEAQSMMDQDLAVCRELGRRDGLGEALASAGFAARAAGDLRRAARYLRQALETALEIRAQYHLMLAFPAVALLLSDRGEMERAVELYALASRYPVVTNSRWIQDVAGKRVAAAGAALPPDAAAAAQERGRARDLWGTAKELLAELRREPESL